MGQMCVVHAAVWSYSQQVLLSMHSTIFYTNLCHQRCILCSERGTIVPTLVSLHITWLHNWKLVYI